MEMFINIIIWIVSVSVLFTIYWFISRKYIHRQFEKNVKKGHFIKFYIGEEKHEGKITFLGNIYVDIGYWDEDTNVRIITRILKSEIYPILGYNYKK